MLRIAIPIIAAAAAIPAIAQLAPAQNAQIAASSNFQPGEWTLRPRAGASETLKLCAANLSALLQIKHANLPCSRYVIANDPQATTVHYTCPGRGHGQTSLRFETPRLAQIETQGIANNEPFQARYEARRLGDCGTKLGMLRN